MKISKESLSKEFLDKNTLRILGIYVFLLSFEHLLWYTIGIKTI